MLGCVSPSIPATTSSLLLSFVRLYWILSLSLLRPPLPCCAKRKCPRPLFLSPRRVRYLGLNPRMVSYSPDSLTRRSNASVSVVGYSSRPRLAELLRSSSKFLYLDLSLIPSHHRMKHAAINLSFSLSFCVFVAVSKSSKPIISLLIKMCSPPASFSVSDDD